MSFLQNAWYVAAWGEEVKKGQVLAREILDTPIVLFRDEAGEVNALIDRCSHRFAKLSMGKMKSDHLECPYHGFQFNGAGECVHNPHGDGRIPARASIRAFPVIERHQAIWVFMGDKERAEQYAVPDFPVMNSDTHFIGVGYMEVAANYLLENDNIMDLSHIEFVHPMFSSPAVSQGAVTCEIEGDQVWSKRDIHNDASPPPFIRQAFNVPDGAVDRWLHVHWQAPSYMTLYAGGMPTGGDADNAIVSVQAHWFTPKSSGSTHYFYAVTLPKWVGPSGQESVDAQVAGLREPFEKEDAPLIEAQQKSIKDKDIMSLRPIILEVDAAGQAARRIVGQLIRDRDGLREASV